jgi:hypothetical protein
LLAIGSRPALAGRGEVGWDTGLGRMTLGLDRQVANVFVAVLDTVFEEEAVTTVL